MTSMATVGESGIDLGSVLGTGEYICGTAPIYVVPVKNGDFNGAPVPGTATGENATTITVTGLAEDVTEVFVDYYIMKLSKNVSELQIDAENFAGSYYVEADTLFREQGTNVDMPAQLTFPNVKIQSNFTFSMAATGDPSTFTFTMDAMPGYTWFNKGRKVLCAIQIVEDATAGADGIESVFPHDEDGHTAADDATGNVAGN